MKKKILLNGTWDFMADLDPRYHATRKGFECPETNRRHWQKVPVPGVWQKYGERYDIFEGVCWFAREFDVQELAKTSTAKLRFGAVNYLANVYVNGEHVGSHEGGYTEFVLDVTEKLKSGRNHVAVQVDNRALITKWPPVLGYFNYGGIHRAVSLEITDGPALEDLYLNPVIAKNGGELTVSGRVAGMCPGIIVRVSSGSLSREAHVAEDGAAIVNSIPFPGVAAWTPEHPHLEDVAVELLDLNRKVLDRHEFQCGFRTIAMKNGRVQINGQALQLNGICYVYDSPVTGLVMTAGQIEADLRLIKEMGCNAIRSHYPMDEAFYCACDRQGLLIWIEPPVYCLHPKDDETNTEFANPVWLELAQKMAIEMITVARNHPSVAIYSIGNECNTGNPEAEAFFRQLASTIRSEDSTRLISYAALYGIVGPIADIVDILGINSYWGWYDKIFGGKGLTPEVAESARISGVVGREPIDLAKMHAMLEKVLQDRKQLALLLTEFGADSVPGYNSRSREMWSEEYHAELLSEIFTLAKEYPQIGGTFPFCFSDYRDPSKIPNGYWNELNLKGAVDYLRNPKLAFSAIRNAYHNNRNGAN